MKNGIILIKGGRVIDPLNKIDEELDVLIEDGKISKVGKNLKGEGDSPLRGQSLDAKGLIVAPGFIDMHTHLRQPGEEDKETLLTASKAALKGGFTSMCAMPNTHPACDNEGVVEYLYSENRKIGLVNIFPFGAITKNLEGKELTEMGELRRAGAVAVTDDGKWVSSSQVMRRALEYSKMFDLVVASHCEDPDLTNGGVMNEGKISTLLGLKGMPQASESAAVARDISLAKLTSGKLHIMHVSTKDSIEFIRKAKKDNLRVTCEATPHHFTLSEEALKGFDTNAKMSPPLRTKEDVEAIKEAFKDGIIDVIATDHAPHAQCDKEVEFDYAPFGIIGLETALSLAIIELVSKKFLSLSRLIEKMSLNPAKILGLEGKGSLSVGHDGDVVIFDPDEEWAFEKGKIQSKSKNSPFIGMKMKGRVKHVIVAGKKVL